MADVDILRNYVHQTNGASRHEILNLISRSDLQNEAQLLEELANDPTVFYDRQKEKYNPIAYDQMDRLFYQMIDEFATQNR
jgi:hypothetical protein